MQIQNEDATRIIREGAKLTLAEGFPAVLLPNVVPVMDMTPNFHRKAIIKSVARAATGSSTIYTLPTGKRFVITGASLCAMADASCDATEFWIGITQNGVSSTRIISFPRLSLTAYSETLSVSFPVPIEVDANSSMSLNMTFTVGSATARATIFGYDLNS